MLLVGDSITRGNGEQVEAGLQGRAYVARLATSKNLGDPALLDQVGLVLGEQKFDIIHFNNGMHGDGYSEEAYTAALPPMLARLRRDAPGARIPLNDLFALLQDHPEYHGADEVHCNEKGARRWRHRWLARF